MAKTLLIAEAGTHYASTSVVRRVNSAKYLAQVAQEAGADYIKYQMFTKGDLFCPLPGDDKRRQKWKNCTLSFKEWFEIKRYCDGLGIGFLASAFQVEPVEWLVALECDFIKVASRAVRDFPYDMVRGFPLIASDGMYPLPHHMEGIKLQCTSKYPTPLKEARWVRHDGISDHSATPWPAIDAMCLGAKAVEVHFWTERWHHDRRSAVNEADLALICRARDAIAEMRQDTEDGRVCPTFPAGRWLASN